MKTSFLKLLNLYKFFMKQIFLVILCFVGMTIFAEGQNVQKDKLNVIIIMAHPDDADYYVGGTANKWAKMGNNVLLVSLTNGDAGHQTIKTKDLAKIRRKEARKAGEVIGVKYITLNNHDGQLMPTYKNRLEVIKIIREHKADVVITHRPYDYHPDHRYTGRLVLDAAYMVTVPKILPEVPFLEKNPLFLYSYDEFIHPEPFKVDVAIDIDDSIDKKMDMLHQHKSQVYEWLPFNEGKLDQVPLSDNDRRNWLGKSYKNITSSAKPFRDKLIEFYGIEKGTRIKYCEVFQDSQYGTKLTKENLYYYFPFLKSEENDN